jgi:hypothetical protein
MTALNAGISVALASAIALGGCMSLGPGQVLAMSTYSICEMQVNQGPNLTEEAHRLLASELDRRKENCTPHRAEIQRMRDEDLWDKTYRNWSP